MSVSRTKVYCACVLVRMCVCMYVRTMYVCVCVCVWVCVYAYIHCVCATCVPVSFVWDDFVSSCSYMGLMCGPALLQFVQLKKKLRTLPSMYLSSVLSLSLSLFLLVRNLKPIAHTVIMYICACLLVLACVQRVTYDWCLWRWSIITV